MNFVEIILVFSICALLFFVSIPSQNQSLYVAHTTLHHHIQNAQIIALTDHRHFTHISQTTTLINDYPSVSATKLMAQSKNALWQVQFHLGKIYATFSYSLYVDTPRDANTTNFDSRPMAGDIIAVDSMRRCISGYNNTNTSFDCKDNLSIDARLSENLGIESLETFASSICAERESGRVYFDNLGFAYCAKVPLKLPTPYQITISKKNIFKHICILPQGKIMGNANGC